MIDADLLERAARFRDSADRIFVRAEVHGLKLTVALTQLPVQEAIDHVLRMLGLTDGVAPASDTPERLRSIELFAWLGEDEYGSGEIGLKQAAVPAGMIPMVAVDPLKMNRVQIADAMRAQAEAYGKKIYLCRYRLEAVLYTTPEGEALK